MVIPAVDKVILELFGSVSKGPKPPKKNISRYQATKLRKAHCKRAAIEPVIGHIKHDHRLNRNFYKGIVGDNINIMLAAAAFNFKRMMNRLKTSLWQIFEMLISIVSESPFQYLMLKRTF